MAGVGRAPGETRDGGGGGGGLLWNVHTSSPPNPHTTVGGRRGGESQASWCVPRAGRVLGGANQETHRTSSTSGLD